MFVTLGKIKMKIKKDDYPRVAQCLFIADDQWLVN